MRSLCCLCLTIFLSLGLPSPCRGGFGATNTVIFASTDDSDEDGLEDAIEEEIGTDPFEPDSDGDDWDDFAEFINQTDPNDPNDFPRTSIIATDGAGTGDPGLRLKIKELLTAHRVRNGTSPNNNPNGILSLDYYYLKGNLPDLAVKLQRSDLKSGSYLLLWRHLLRWNPLGNEQRYTVSVKTDDGHTVLTWQTPEPVGTTWSHVGLPFVVKPAEEGKVLTLSVTPESGGMQYAVADFAVVSAGIEADVDRDGHIARDERPKGGRPLRHWVNDDDDHGEWQGQADLPGLTVSSDHASPGVDGLRDLVDFMPINLNLARVIRLLPPTDGFDYFLRNEDRAVQVVLTSLSPAAAGTIHRNPDLRTFGNDLDGPIATAEVLMPDNQGRIALPLTFVERLRDRGNGVLLLEGTRTTHRPLWVEIFQHGRCVAKLEQPLAVGPVESMYRHVDLSGVAREFSGRPAERPKKPRLHQIDEPAGRPDIESSDRWVVMIHGYNVPADSARSWHAETFKRLHVMGSDARFVGVTWNGDTGLDYHKAVFQAFQTGDEVPRALGFLDASRTTLIAHSLGNIVASQAVQAGFTPACYFMLNAALPIEALAGEADLSLQATAMTEHRWRPYPRKLYASDWSRIFSADDPRSTYTWINCFSRIRSAGNVINCFSPGEDVTNCPPETQSASVLATLWAGRSVDYGVWKTQELLKGVGANRSLAMLAMERSQGGWGFNLGWRGRFVPHGPDKAAGGHYELVDPVTAGKLSPHLLRIYPFFRHFREIRIHYPGPMRLSPLLNLQDLRYDLLARGIPSQSYAAWAEPVPGMANLDLEQTGRNPAARWPTDGHTDKKRSHRWLHSDFKNVALPFVHPLFATMSQTPAHR